MNSQLKLEYFIFGCYPYNRENHSATQIRIFVDNKLSEYHLKLNNEIFVVTDNENRMKSALEDSCSRVGCGLHYLNKQLEHAFNATEIDKVKVNCDLVQEMLSNIRKIISHVTKPHKQCQLSHKVVSYSDTRFNGAFISMNVFLLVFDEILGALGSNVIDCYPAIDKELLECVCSFLKVCDKAIEELSQDYLPTIHKVLPLREYILKHCQINSYDDDGIKQTKAFLDMNEKMQKILMLLNFLDSK